MALIIDIADAVVAELNATAFGVPFTATPVLLTCKKKR